MRSGLKITLFIVLWAGLFAGLVLDSALRDTLFRLLARHEVLAPFAFVLIQMVFATLALPCSPLSVLAGLLWGLELGLVYAVLATVASAAWTFALGRWLLRGRLFRAGRPDWYARILALIERHHWKAAMIAFANPVFPGSSLGYAFGLSRIGFAPFLLGALLGTLPVAVPVVGAGDIAGRVLASAPSLWVLAATVAVVAAIAAYRLLAPRLLDRL